MNISACTYNYNWLMAENRATDSPSWWKGEGTDLLNSEDTFKYPPELLGTSWGSYLFSVPPTAHGGQSGRKVVIADTLNCKNGASQGLFQKSSPKRSILRTPGRTITAEPHPLSQRLLATLRGAQEVMTSCGMDTSPLDHASATLKHLHRDNTTVMAGEECIEVVLDALVNQSRKLQEHAVTLHQTAIMLAKNQKQFVRDQQQFQQMVESYITKQERQQLEGKMESIGKESSLCKKNLHQNKKTYTMGLREGQHKLALMQTRKEHLRLEKSLLQQQRDVRRLEQAYKTTTSDLAAKQYCFENLQKKLHRSDLLLQHKKRICGLKQKFNEYNQQLHQLVHQLETSKQELVETGSRLRLEEREAHIPISTNTLTQEQSLNLPPIARSPQQRKQHHLINSPQFSLPLLSSHELKSTGSHKRKKNTGQLSRLELMSLAKFRNPETAEQVISWLEKTGAVNLSDK